MYCEKCRRKHRLAGKMGGCLAHFLDSWNLALYIGTVLLSICTFGFNMRNMGK